MSSTFGPAGHQIVVSLTNTQIKAIPTDSFVIIPAPGAGRAIIPIAVIFQYNTVAGLYTNADAATWELYSGLEVYNAISVMFQPRLNSDAAAYINAVAGFGALLVGAGTWEGFDNQLGDIVANVPIYLRDLWNTGAYTGGHASNTLKVSVAYYILNVSTGEFE